MVKASITYLGGIEEGNYTDIDYTTLTGSATIAKFCAAGKKISLLIDYGAFQGGKIDDIKNNQVHQEALDTNAIVLTHSHLDHCGRIPLLVKNGYKNPIYMTKMTKDQAVLILLDSIKISKEYIEEMESKITKLRRSLQEDLFIIECNNRLIKNNLSKEDREKIKSQLHKKIGNRPLNKAAEKAQLELEEYNITCDEDIVNLANNIPELLFDVEDVDNMLKLVKILDLGEEETINDEVSISDYTPNTLSYILKKINHGYDKKILIKIAAFNEIKEELNQLILDTKKAEEENILIKQRNSEKKNQIEKALDFVLEIDNLLEQVEDIVENQEEFLRNTQREDCENTWLQYNEYKQYLSQYEGIETNYSSTISSILEPINKIKYSSEFLEQVKSQLKHKVPTNGEKNKKIIDSVKLCFEDAGHIEGSIQARITVVTEQVLNQTHKILSHTSNTNTAGFSQVNQEHKNFVFTGDLGRRVGKNLPNVLQMITDLKLDYFQIETTYGDKDHPEREKSEQKFVDIIKRAPGKVIVPVFSLQRTPEMVITLLNRMLDRKNDRDELDDIKIDLKETQEEYDAILDKNSIEAIELERSMKLIKQDLIDIKRSIFFYDIVIDAPLAIKILELYNESGLEQYNILRPKIQEELFGREVVSVISNKEEQGFIYQGKRANKKEIIFSSGGMCEGGAILSHLGKNLGNPKSTLLFIGYCPEDSKGGKIKNGKPVYIEGESYDVKCRIEDVSGFSGHIDKKEILEYLSAVQLSRGATIALTHGGEVRDGLKKEIKQKVLKNRGSIKVVVPDLGDTTVIKM